MKLEMTQKQELKLTPQMLQSMEILQMSTQELEAYLQELVQENPAAELSEPEERPDEGEELWRRMQSLADQDNQNRQYVAAEREELDPLARVGTDGGLEDTLLLHLSRQLERSQAPTLVLRGAQFLAACLDEAGYLREKVENLAQAAGLPAAVLEEGLSLLQTLDPAGVGARDLSQCLELQLRRRGEEGTALAIVQRGLERLARRQYRALAQELGVSRQEVLRAEAQIRALDPRPGAAFAPREEPVYLVPDLVVLQGEHGLAGHLQESRLPGLRRYVPGRSGPGGPPVSGREDPAGPVGHPGGGTAPCHPAPVRPGAGPAAGGVFPESRGQLDVPAAGRCGRRAVHP